MSALDNFCPYVGLQPFTEKDNAFFFGRERDQRIITSNLYAAPLTVMYGASGVGKSSILMAGVVPTLRAKSRTAVVVYRNWQDSNFHADFKAQILADLQAAQKKSLAINPALPLDDFLADACEKFGGTIFILLDQFEEYFLYQPETRGTESFDAELARAINRTDVEASFLFSLREDALSKLDRFRARIPNLLGNTLRLNHLDAAAAEIAIRKPLEVYNARYPDRALKIEDALVTEIIAQVRTGKVVMGSGGSGASQSSQTTAQIETPFLQLVLTRLWEEEMQIIARAKTHPTEKTVSTRQRLTDSLMLSLKPKTTLEHAGVLELATLKRLGGAEQIVRTHLDGVMGKLTATEQDICSNFFDRLVTPSGAKIAQINADLVKWAARPPEQVTPILKALVDARVLRTVAPPIDQPTAIRYEIFHDVLGPAVLDWRRRFVETQRQIRERARLRRLRLTAFGAIALTLIFGVLSIFALYQRGAAEDARAVAVDQRNDAQRANEESIVRLLMTQSRETLTSNPARSVLLALEALHLVNEFGFGTPSFFNNIQTADDTLRRAVFTSRGFALPAHTDIVYTVAISPDNRWFASASRDKTVRLWNVAQVLKFDQNGIAQNASQILRGNEKDVRVLEFTPDSRWLITASDDGNARMYDLRASDPNASQIILKGHTKEIRSLAISKDGHYLVTGSNDKTARVWDLRAANPAATPILLTGHSDPLFGVAISPNSRWVATASDDNTARIYDLTAREPNGAVTILRGHTDQVSVISFSPDGHWLVTGSADATARVWDMTAPNPAVAVKILRGHEEPVLALAFAPDSSLLATGGFDTTARLWDLNATDPSAKQIVLRGHSDQILSLAFTTDRRFLITASRDSTMAMWDLTMPDPTIAPIILHGHEGAVRQVAVSTDGKLLLSAGEDNIVRITGVTVPLSPITPIILSGHSSVARAVQFSNDGKWLATGSGDSTVRLWQMNTDDPGGNVIVLRGHQSAIFSIAISNDSRWLASGSQDADALLWDLTSISARSQPIVLRGHTEALRVVEFSADNKWLVTAGRDATIRLWNIPTIRVSTQPNVLTGHTNQIRIAKFSPNSRWLVTGGDDGSPRLWDLSAADPAKSAIVLPGHTGAIRAAAFSPDNRWLVTGGDDKVLRVWDLNSNKIQDSAKTLPGHEQVIRVLAFTPDNRFLVSASGDQTIRLWDFTDPLKPSIRKILRGHQGEVRALAISSDSHYLVSSSEDATARVWDLTSPDPSVRTIILPGHNGPVWAVAISPDNQWTATVSGDRTGRLWHLATLEDVSTLACQRVGRNLTVAEWNQNFAKVLYRTTCSNLPATLR